MRSHIILLLAVFSNHITAGLVRQRGQAYIQHDKFRRFYNASSVATTSRDLQTTSPIAIPSPSSSFSFEATSEAPSLARRSTSLSPVSSTVSAAAESSQKPAIANSQSVTPSTNAPVPNAVSTSTAVSATRSSSSESGASISTIGGVSSQSEKVQKQTTQNPTQSSASGSEFGNVQNQGPKAEFVAPSSVSAKPSASVGQSQPYTGVSSQTTAESSSSAAVVQFGPSNSAEFDSITVTSLSVTPTATHLQYPGTQNGNRAMATGFNQVYKQLDETSQCNPQDSNEATACVSGELASCQSDGTYVLKSCPNGQSCYALPKPSGATGINVECAVPSDAAARLSEESNAGNGPAAAPKASSTVQTSANLVAGNTQAISKLPETVSAQLPAQGPSTSSQTSATHSSPRRESAAASASSNVQSASMLPQSQDLPLPSQRQSSSQGANTLVSQAKQNSAAIDASPSATPESKSMSTESSAEVKQTSAQAIANAQSHGPSQIATTDAQSAALSQTASQKQAIQTLNSFPAVQATHTQQASSIPPSSAVSSLAVQTQKYTPTRSSADDGPLFSLPTTTAKEANHPPQPTASSTSAPESSKAATSPSVLVQEQPAPSTETSLAPAPHVLQAASVASPPSKSATASPSNPDAAGGGVQIVPEGGSNPADAPHPTTAPVTNEKVAVQNAAQKPNQGGTPIFITVTVTSTTTAHDLSPTA
ncbi:hypothetical protein ACLMJK_000489 [Lecanora helva]